MRRHSYLEELGWKFSNFSENSYCDTPEEAAKDKRLKST